LEVGTDLNVNGISNLKESNIDGNLLVGPAGNVTFQNNLTVSGTTSTANITSTGDVNVALKLLNNQPGSETFLTKLNVSGNSNFENTINTKDVLSEGNIVSDGYIKTKKHLIVDEYANIAKDINASENVNIAKNINIDGYIRKDNHLEAYTQPDGYTFIHMKFDESEGAYTSFLNTGESKDYIPRMDRHGTPDGTILYSTSAGGLFGNSLWSNGYGTTPYSANDQSSKAYWLQALDHPSHRPGSKITVSCWVKMTAWHANHDDNGTISGGYYNTIVSKKYNNDMGHWGGTYPATPASFEISTGAWIGEKIGSWFVRVGVNESITGPRDLIIKVTASDKRLTLNEWHLLSLTYDGDNGQLKAYFDGQPAGTATAVSGSQISYDNGSYYVGFVPLSQVLFRSFPGFIDDVRIENTVRDNTYISDMYNKAKYLLDYGSNASLDMGIASESLVFSNYPRNSRIYAETWGALTLAQNAKWNSATKKWQQENKSFPSSLVWSKPVISYPPESTESYNFTVVGVLSKRSGLPDWDKWDKTDFTINSGTSTLLNETAKTLSFTNVFMGPTGTESGYSQLILRGNTKRGVLENQTGGPRIHIDKSYPSPANVQPNSLYSANIPKAIVTFRYYPGVTNTEVSNAFNVISVIKSTNCFAVFFKESISDMSVFCSVRYSDTSLLAKGIDYSARSVKVTDSLINVFLVKTNIIDTKRYSDSTSFYFDPNGAQIKVPVDTSSGTSNALLLTTIDSQAFPSLILSDFDFRDDIYINVMVFGKQ
jgi:cytoskeletal protein CcmA (bactofilin family)